MWQGEVTCECRPTPEEIQERKDRIAIRRSRIDAKIALENAGNEEPLSSVPSSLDLFLGDDGEEDEKKKMKGDPFDQMDSHIEQSRKNLEQILQDGDTLVTNVKVAAEYREKDRHERLEEDKKERFEKLHAEADECEVMYKDIEKNWMLSAEKLLPLELYEKIKVQQKACDELLEKRQDLIEDLMQGIDDNDWEFEHNLEVYQKDVMLMGDRIDDLVDKLRESFVEELQLIEDYTAFDREQMLERNQNEWQELMDKFEEMESSAIEERQKEAVKRFDALGDIYNDVKEQTKIFKKSMEDDLRNLQLELEHIKFATVLNMEKLEYNLEVLRRRENENLKMKNSMKRLLLRLQDRFNDKAQALKNQIDKGRKDNDKIIKEIRRLEYLNRDARRKTLHVVATDYHRFMDLWVLHEEEARDKLNRLLGSERYIFESQLGVKLPEVDIEELNNRPQEVHCFINKVQYVDPNSQMEDNSPKASDMGLTKVPQSRAESKADVPGLSSSSQDVAQGACRPKTEASLLVDATDSNEFLPGPGPDPLLQRRLMKHITKVICEQTGFIVEEKLRKILAPMIRTERMLIHFDAVLQALGINNIAEMQVLARYMLRRCTVMKGVMSKMGTAETPILESMQVSLEGLPPLAAEDEGLERLKKSLMHSMSIAGEEAAYDLEQEEEEEDREAKLIGIIMPRALAMTASSEMSSDPPATAEVPPSAQRVLSAIALEGLGKIIQVRLPQSAVQVDLPPVVEDSDGNLTPVSDVSMPSLEGIIQEFGSNASLGQVLHMVDKKQIQEGIDIQDDPYTPGTPCSCESPSTHSSTEVDVEARKDSLVTNEAEIMTWLKFDEVLGGPVPIPIPSAAVEEDEVNFSDDEFAGEFEHDGEGGGQRRKEGKKKAMLQQKAGSASGANDSSYITESHTVSIPSHPSTAAGSDEFLYIEPNDVLEALAEFCKDYNAKIKVELPSDDELIESKLAKLRFPSEQDVQDYWDKFLFLLDPKSQELWDAALFCFEEYGKLLSQRNQYIRDCKRIHKQNTELSQLLKGHMRQNPRANINMDAQTLPYC